MKRIFAISVAIALLLSLCSGCAKEERQEGISIVATVFPPYDFARQIAGEKASVKLLLPPGADSHSFEPTPQDIIAVDNCDIFIWTGGESESWVEDMLSSLENGPGTVISMLDLVELLHQEVVEGMEPEEHGHDHDHHNEDYDEHVWTSPVNAGIIARAIGQRLMEADPENEAEYAANLEDYCEELDKLDSLIRETVDNGVRNTLLFGDRFPMRYFTEEYGLTYYAAFPGCSAETEASAATLAFLIDKVKAEGIPAVIKMELSNGKVAQIIAEATGARVLTLSSCHNLTRQEMDEGITYLDMMYGNLENLKEALN